MTGALLLALVAAAPERRLVLSTAEGHLDHGRPRLAVQLYQQVLDDRPGSRRARVGLVRAHARMGHCAQVFSLLDALDHDPDGRLRLAEGTCLLRTGRPLEALDAFEDAVAWAPELVEGWFALGTAALHAGDVPAFSRAVEVLPSLDGGDRPAAVLDVAAAVEWGRGDPDARLAELERIGAVGVSARVLDGRRWMDLDDPWRAAELLFDALQLDMHHAQAASWRAEALRRTGQIRAAQACLERPAFAPHAEGPLARAIRARIAVDRGDLPGAAAELSGHPDPGDPEAVASAWYLARARGDPGADHLATHWQAISRAAQRRLEQLDPP